MILDRQGPGNGQEKTYVSGVASSTWPQDHAGTPATEEEALPAEYDSGTDSDTISSIGEEDLDFRDLAGLTVADSDLAVSISCDDERREVEPAAALDDLGDTVDVDGLLNRRGVFVLTTTSEIFSHDRLPGSMKLLITVD